MSIMSSQKPILLLAATSIFFILPNLLLNVKAQDPPDYVCIDIGTYYPTNSTFQANLNNVFSALPPDNNTNGFNNASFGQSPDRVYAVALCRGDILPDTCRTCVQNATSQLLELCPNRRQAILWMPLLTCMVRYSNEPILGAMETIPAREPHSLLSVTSSPDQFMTDLRTLLRGLYNRAASGNSSLKVAAGTSRVSNPSLEPIYALVQCTPDLSPDNCTSCLRNATDYVSICCDRMIGARILRPSCIIRYEITPFYDPIRLQNLGPIFDTTSSSHVPSGTRNSVRLIVINISIVASVILAISAALLLRRVMKKQKPKQESALAEDISLIQSFQYEFDKIRAATDDFSEANKLGEGGFGAVYKGQFENGLEIAVKRLAPNSCQGGVEFMNEVMLLARLTHRNLVRLLGFVLHGSEKLLVYEFLANGSLEHFIFERSRETLVYWDQCYRIIRGIAKGLLYLHEDSQIRIIHRDLKLSNILLDSEMNPKIADFGIARLFVPDETHGNTKRIVGTYGYMAPEYAIHGQFSIKSDIFSFGVLVLEIISGRKNINFGNHESVEDLLISIAWRNWRDGTPKNVIDPLLMTNSGVVQEILRCIQIGLLCVQENAAARPAMSSIFLMLSSGTISVPVPSAPAYFLPRECDLEVLSTSVDVTSDAAVSVNDVTITELNPR